MVVVIVIAGEDLRYYQNLFPNSTVFPVPAGVEMRPENVQL
jgi:hypothetical protein